MSGQRWRTYALLLHFYATYRASTWCIGYYGNPWGYVATMFLVGTCLVGLIVPVVEERAARHRAVEVDA